MNIIEILKDCPKWTCLYSPIFGEVKLFSVNKDYIRCITSYGFDVHFQCDGKYLTKYTDAECMLFPSKDQRDWSKFRATNKETKPQLKPFDKVLVRDEEDDEWVCDIFSHIDELHELYYCVGTIWKQCIAYEGNEHLLGTSKTNPINNGKRRI